MILTIHHRTRYRYARAVTLLPHRMMLCPRDQHDMKLVSNSLHCSPSALIEWTQDVFGNLIATAHFPRPVEVLTIDSKVVVDQSTAAWPIFKIAPYAHSFPFAYAPDDTRDLGSLREASEDPSGVLQAWLAQFRPDAPTDTLDLLKAINARIAETITYRVREEEGTQSSIETLSIGSGSCRDLATLFIDAVRHLGFGARAVSGYAFEPSRANDDLNTKGSTHAWAEVYLPCAGWIPFDPTASRVGSLNLITVAVSRSIAQISPVDGHFAGEPEDFLDMEVEVTIEAPSGSMTEPQTPLR